MALITKEDVKIEVGIQENDITRDSLLDVLVEAVQSIFDGIANRVMEEATFTEYHSGGVRQSKLLLKNYPIISIASLHDDPDWDYGVSELISSSDYTFNSDEGIVYYDGAFYKAENNIKVVYTAGYGGTIDLPVAVKQVLIRQAAHWHNQAKNKTWAVSSSVDPTGGSNYQAFSQLQDNLLPDFVMVAELYKAVR